MTSQHSVACDARHAAKQAYDAKYPNFCRQCHGEGALHTPGTYDDPPWDEWCECVLEGRCPRCGHQHDENWNVELDDAPEPCQVCGWHPTSGDSRPDDDCDCDQTPDCSHVPSRLYSWYARDDTAPNGQHLCVACCDCGTVLR